MVHQQEIFAHDEPATAGPPWHRPSRSIRLQPRGGPPAIDRDGAVRSANEVASNGGDTFHQRHICGQIVPPCRQLPGRRGSPGDYHVSAAGHRLRGQPIEADRSACAGVPDQERGRFSHRAEAASGTAVQPARAAMIRRPRRRRRPAMICLSSSPQCVTGGPRRSRIQPPLPADAPGPGVEIVDVVPHVTTVAAEAWPRARGAHLLKLAGAQTQIESGLLGRKERAPLLGPCRAGDIIVHCTPHFAGRRVAARPEPPRMARFSRRAEARKWADRKSSPRDGRWRSCRRYPTSGDHRLHVLLRRSPVPGIARSNTWPPT